MKNNQFRDKLKAIIVESSLIISAFLLFTLAPSLLASEETGDSSPYKLIIDDITCRDNENTECSFIVKKYYQQVGDLVDPEEIADAKLRLGTLFQFRNIRIVLEKSKQRDHVVVVFIVEESEQLQYNAGLSYSGIKDENNKLDSYTASVGVTNYNFLGTGKELNFSLLKGDSVVDLGFSEATLDENSQIISLGPIKFSQNSDQIGLSYYDPHLFDSKRYYLRSSIGYSRDSIDGTFSSLLNDLSTKTASLAFGKRFASHSYIEIISNYSKLSGNVIPFESENLANLAYGWDSRDDLLFPTRGSVFTIQLVDLANDGRDGRTVGFNYSDNISFSDELVFNYDIRARAREKTSPFVKRFTDTYSTFALSDIDSSGKKDGRYSGWKYRIKIPLQNTSSEDISYGVTYIYQTDTLVMQFSLDYVPGEENIF